MSAAAGEPGPAHVRTDPPAAAAPSRARSYRGIVASSALIGGSSALNIAIGALRTKGMALMLGPSGFGLMGAYLLVCDLARAVAQMGLNASGVRQIAAAVATGDDALIARTVQVLRRTSIACGLLGAGLLATLCIPVSVLTFGDARHAGAVALLGAAVFFFVVAGGQGALLQGTRRIGDLSRLTVLGGVAGTVVGLPTVYLLGERGVALTLVMVAATGAAASWWYARRVPVAPVVLGRGEFRHEAGALLKLGLAFMASGLFTMGAAYVVRIIVLRHVGLAGAGVYQAAWTIGGVYTGFVLQAMGTDFYPRLVAAMGELPLANQLVNEQAQVSMLLALPGVLGTLTLAPLIVPLLYSASFAAAGPALRWICLGMAMRVLTWPIGFIIVAQSRQRLFLALECGWALVNVALTWVAVGAFGVDGAGMAFLGAYVVHALVLYPIVRRTSGFRWSRANLVIALASLAAIGGVFIGFLVLPAPLSLGLGLAATVASTCVCVRSLVTLVEPRRLPPRLARWLRVGRPA